MMSSIAVDRAGIRNILPAAVMAVVLACLWAGCGKEESGVRFETTAYKEMDKSFQPLRRDFEGEAGRVRLVALVAPTCGRCVESLEAIYAVLLPRIKSEDFVVFVIWAGVTPGDVGPRAAQAAEMFVDARFLHYFDSSGRIARAFGQLMDLETGKSVYDVFYLYGPDDTWDPQADMMDEPEDYNALLEGWTPGPSRYRMGEHVSVQIPIFDLNAMEREIRKLLDESGSPGGEF